MSERPLSPPADPRLAARAKGRGAHSNGVGRFERLSREAEEDGWDREDDLPPLRTEIQEEAAGNILTRNTSPDISFDRSINPYRGCEHGCTYCFARPSHAYLGLSAGLDFETRLTAKSGAAEALERTLRRKGYRPATIAIGTNTDAYQPIERDRQIMREILEVLDRFNHPVAIVTKGSLIERDIDILAPMAARGLARVGISVTTLDADLSRSMEPRVPAPKRRIATIRTLSEAGIPVRICASPLIPGLTDHELEAILEAGQEAGAVAASMILLRLPTEVAPLFREWITQARPDRAARVLARVRDTHGGKDYDSRWFTRMRGQGTYANMIHQRWSLALKRLGLAAELPDLRSDLFEVPLAQGNQLSLF